MLRTEIIILNWNGAGYLRRFLPGVTASAPAGVGVTVADNCSTDDSVGLLERDFPQVRVIRLDRNYGYAEGYNRALAEVDADCYVLLNSDVETPAGWLEPLLDELDRHPDVGVVAPKLRAVEDRARFEYAGASGGYLDFFGYPFCRGRILQHLEEDGGQYDDARDVFWVSGAAFCCRAGAFRALGGFDGEFFAHMEEIDLCWRMQLAGWRVRIVPQSCVYHLGGGTLDRMSAAKVRYNHRNNLAMLLKCASPAQRWCVALARPLLDALAALSYLVQGRADHFLAVARAYREFFGMHASMLRKRHEVQAAKKAARITGIYGGSIVLRYMLGRRRFDKMMR